MPIIKSAKKKLRLDKRRTAVNLRYKNWVKKTLKQARASKKSEDVKKACQALDRAAKRGVFHKNKTSRLKSRLVRFVKVP